MPSALDRKKKRSFSLHLTKRHQWNTLTHMIATDQRSSSSPQSASGAATPDVAHRTPPSAAANMRRMQARGPTERQDVSDLRDFFNANPARPEDRQAQPYQPRSHFEWDDDGATSTATPNQTARASAEGSGGGSSGRGGDSSTPTQVRPETSNLRALRRNAQRQQAQGRKGILKIGDSTDGVEGTGSTPEEWVQEGQDLAKKEFDAKGLGVFPTRDASGEENESGDATGNGEGDGNENGNEDEQENKIWDSSAVQSGIRRESVFGIFSDPLWDPTSGPDTTLSSPLLAPPAAVDMSWCGWQNPNSASASPSNAGIALASTSNEAANSTDSTPLGPQNNDQSTAYLSSVMDMAMRRHVEWSQPGSNLFTYMTPSITDAADTTTTTATTDESIPMTTPLGRPIRSPEPPTNSPTMEIQSQRFRPPDFYAVAPWETMPSGISTSPDVVSPRQASAPRIVRRMVSGVLDTFHRSPRTETSGRQRAVTAANTDATTSPLSRFRTPSRQHMPTSSTPLRHQVGSNEPMQSDTTDPFRDESITVLPNMETSSTVDDPPAANSARRRLRRAPPSLPNMRAEAMQQALIDEEIPPMPTMSPTSPTPTTSPTSPWSLTSLSSSTSSGLRWFGFPKGPDEPGWDGAVKYAKKCIAEEKKRQATEAREQRKEQKAENERLKRMARDAIKRGSRSGYMPKKPVLEMTDENFEVVGEIVDAAPTEKERDPKKNKFLRIFFEKMNGTSDEKHSQGIEIQKAVNKRDPYMLSNYVNWKTLTPTLQPGLRLMQSSAATQSTPTLSETARSQGEQAPSGLGIVYGSNLPPLPLNRDRVISEAQRVLPPSSNCTPPNRVQGADGSHRSLYNAMASPIAGSPNAFAMAASNEDSGREERPHRHIEQDRQGGSQEDMSVPYSSIATAHMSSNPHQPQMTTRPVAVLVYPPLPPNTDSIPPVPRIDQTSYYDNLGRLCRLSNPSPAGYASRYPIRIPDHVLQNPAHYGQVYTYTPPSRRHTFESLDTPSPSRSTAQADRDDDTRTWRTESEYSQDSKEEMKVFDDWDNTEDSQAEVDRYLETEGRQDYRSPVQPTHTADMGTLLQRELSDLLQEQHDEQDRDVPEDDADYTDEEEVDDLPTPPLNLRVLKVRRSSRHIQPTDGNSFIPRRHGSFHQRIQDASRVAQGRVGSHPAFRGEDDAQSPIVASPTNDTSNISTLGGRAYPVLRSGDDYISRGISSMISTREPQQSQGYRPRAIERPVAAISEEPSYSPATSPVFERPSNPSPRRAGAEYDNATSPASGNDIFPRRRPVPATSNPQPARVDSGVGMTGRESVDEEWHLGRPMRRFLTPEQRFAAANLTIDDRGMLHNRDSMQTHIDETPPRQDIDVVSLRAGVGLGPQRLASASTPHRHPNHPYQWNHEKVMCYSIHNPKPQILLANMPLATNPENFPSALSMSSLPSGHFQRSPPKPKGRAPGAKRCKGCGNSCCRYTNLISTSSINTGGDLMEEMVRAKAEERANYLRSNHPNGIEEYDTFLKCAACKLEFCPKCISLCTDRLCRDVVCRNCVGESGLCQIHNVI